MAYDGNMWQVQVRGSLSGGEEWANTWTFHRFDPDAEIQDVIDALHTFYAAIASALWTSQSAALSASWRQLNGVSSGDGAWTTITGSAGGSSLPTECALRLSFSDGAGHRGGPYLAGFRAGDLATDGTFVSGSADVILDALDDMLTTIHAAFWDLSIDRATAETTVDVTLAKVGLVFDVQRRRRNELPENAVTLVVNPAGP